MPAEVSDSTALPLVVRLPARFGELAEFFFVTYSFGFPIAMVLGAPVVIAFGTYKGVFDTVLIVNSLLPVVPALSWMRGMRRRSVTFSDEALEVVRSRRRYRILWSQIETVRFDDHHDREGRPRDRTIVVRYQRDPNGRPALPNSPSLRAYRDWDKANFRSVRIPLLFNPPDAPDSRRRDQPLVRKRRIILEQFLVRGFPLS